MSKLPASVVLFINTFGRKSGWAVAWLYCVSIERQPRRAGRLAHLHEAFSAYTPLGQRIVIDRMEPIFPARGVMIGRINMPMALNIGRILIAALFDRPMPNSIKLIDDGARPTSNAAWLGRRQGDPIRERESMSPCGHVPRAASP